MRTLADFIFDLAQNSINAKARNISVLVEEDTYKKRFVIIIKDDGRGIRAEDLPKVKQPFFTTRDRSKRKVGLGLALMDQVCQESSGELTVESELGTGTTVRAVLQHDHVDRPPTGDLAGVFTTLLVDMPVKNLHWTLEHKFNLRRYKLESEKLLDELHLSNFSGIEAKKKVLEYIQGKEKSVQP